jgi:hypothetical protein
MFDLGAALTTAEHLDRVPQLEMEALMSRSRFTLGALVACAMFLAATPAMANQPEILRFSDSNYDSPEVFVDACGPGADLISANEIHVTEISYLDPFVAACEALA